MYALARDIDAKDNETFYRKLRIDGELLGAARPTAVNLRWAVGEMLDTDKAHLKDDRAELLEALYRKAVDIHEDDIAKCTAISEYGLSLLKDGDGVLTHCNAGPLATSRYGTGRAPSCWRQSEASTSACLPTRPAPFCKGRGSPAMSCSGRGWT